MVDLCCLWHISAASEALCTPSRDLAGWNFPTSQNRSVSGEGIEAKVPCDDIQILLPAARIISLVMASCYLLIRSRLALDFNLSWRSPTLQRVAIPPDQHPGPQGRWESRKKSKEAVFQLECVHIRAGPVWTAGFCSYSDHMSLRMLVTWDWLSYFVVVVRLYTFFFRVGES